MTTSDFIRKLFCGVDNYVQAVPKHPKPNFTPARLSLSLCSVRSKARLPEISIAGSGVITPNSVLLVIFHLSEAG